jgi:hypothetical protein
MNAPGGELADIELPAQRFQQAPVPIMFLRIPDEVAEMRRAWPKLEGLVGLRGRRFYGIVDGNTVGGTDSNTDGSAVDGETGDYLVAAQIRDTDPADRFGLETGEIAGGTYLRMRLRGKPPALYDRIGPGFRRLHAMADADPTRRDVEFYRRHTEIDLWLPVVADRSA